MSRVEGQESKVKGQESRVPAYAATLFVCLAVASKKTQKVHGSLFRVHGCLLKANRIRVSLDGSGTQILIISIVHQDDVLWAAYRLATYLSFLYHQDYSYQNSPHF